MHRCIDDALKKARRVLRNRGRVLKKVVGETVRVLKNVFLARRTQSGPLLKEVGVASQEVVEGS